MTRIRYWLEKERVDKLTLYIQHGAFKKHIDLGDGLFVFTEFFGMSFDATCELYKDKVHSTNFVKFQEFIARDIIKHLIGLDDHESLTQKELKKFIGGLIVVDLGKIIQR